MKSKGVRILSVFLALTLLSAVAACGGSEGQTSPEASDTAPEISASQDAPPASPDVSEEPSLLPLTEEPITFTYWHLFSAASTSGYYDDLADAVYYQTLSERTNVYFEFIPFDNQNAQERYNIMVASDEYYDLLNNVHQWAASGIDDAIDNEVIIDIKDYFDYTPNYKAVLEANPDVMKNFTTDSGAIGMFRGFFEETIVRSGPIVRTDWLDELGVKAEDIQTYDDWYDLLTKFKTEFGADKGMFIWTDGISEMVAAGMGLKAQSNLARNLTPFIMVDNEVRFTYLMDEFYDYLEMIKKWYDEGLIDSDFYATGATISYPEDKDIIEGETGIWQTMLARWSYYEALMQEYPEFDMAPLALPTANASDSVTIVFAEDMSAGLSNSISTQCSNIEVASRLFDYGYSDEGYILNNYGGVEGETFNYIDGTPVLSDLIINNPEGMSYGVAVGYYAKENGSFVISVARDYPSYSENQARANPTWAGKITGADNYPYYATLTTDESAQFSSKYADIQTYASTAIVEFIIGIRPLDEFDRFRQELSSMGIEDCIAVKQSAADRYLLRG